MSGGSSGTRKTVEGFPAGARNLNSAIQGGREHVVQQHPPDVDFNPLMQILSFNPFGQSGREDRARVNIVDATGPYGTLQNANDKFLSIATLVCVEKKGLEFSLSSSVLREKAQKGKGSEYEENSAVQPAQKVKVEHIQSIQNDINDRNSVTVHFKNKDYIELQFLYKIDAEKFFKKLDVLVQVLRKSGPIVKKPQKSKLVQIQVTDRTQHSKVEKASKSISAHVRMSFITKVEENQFYNKKAEEWTAADVKYWLSYVFVQVGGQNGKIMSLLEHLRNIKETSKASMWTNLSIFITKETHNVFFVEKAMKDFIKNRTEPDTLIANLVQNPAIRKCFMDEIKLINKNGGYFDMAFARCLEKKLRRIGQGIPLDLVKKRFQNEWRHFWDVEEMRDFIICQILFQKKLREVIDLYEKKFDEFLVESLKKKDGVGFEENIEETEGEQDGDGDSDDDEEELIHPVLYNKILKNFNSVERCDIHKMSFKIFLKCKENSLRMKKSKMEKEAESKVKEIEDRQKQIHIDIKTFQAAVTQKKDRKSYYFKNIGSFNDMEAFDNLIQKLDDEINEVTENESKAKNELKDLKEKLFKLFDPVRKLDDEIMRSNVQLGQHLKPEFLISSVRRDAWKKFLKDVIEMKCEEKGNVEIVTKLVLSVLRVQRDGGMREGAIRLAMKIIDPIVNPGFFKFGFMHASVLLSSLGIHWFKNGFVFLNQLSFSDTYDEVFCVDANCPLILSQNTIYESMTNLAEEIVKTNINKDYAEVSVVPSGPSGVNTLNCQEFTNNLLGTLKYTKFFPETNLYIKAAKNKLCGDGKKSANDIRFMVVEKKFAETFASVLSNEDFKPVKEKIYGAQYTLLYFKSHKHLDHFLLECLNVDSFFRINYPGVYQLLKGFDRAFWMRFDSHPNDEALKPAHICPMNDRKFPGSFENNE